MKDVHTSLLTIVSGIGGFYTPPGGIQSRIRGGLPIPERLLPGRLMMAVSPERRAELANTNWKNVSDWWVKLMCS